ncbi:hypothetical protein FD755_014615, partial [Muntiacus reevesi]
INIKTKTKTICLQCRRPGSNPWLCKYTPHRTVICRSWDSDFFFKYRPSVQFSSVTQSCRTLCDPMNCSTPGLPHDDLIYIYIYQRIPLINLTSPSIIPYILFVLLTNFYLFPPPTSPWKPLFWSLVSMSLTFFFLKILHVVGFPSFSWLNNSSFHACVPYCLYPFICQWTLRLLPCLGCCKGCFWNMAVQERARSCLPFLVSQLASMEHSFHHILLMEIKSITDTFSSILGPQSRDIFRMSNSFTAISTLLTRQLETTKARNDRSKSLALHAVLTNPLSAEDGEAVKSRDTPVSISLSEIDPLGQGHERSLFKVDTNGSQLVNSSVSHQSIIHVASENLPEAVKKNYQEEIPETTTSPVEYRDKLYLHLKENFSKVKAYAVEMVKKIPVPDQCTIEDLDDSPCTLVGHDIFSHVTALIEKSQAAPRLEKRLSEFSSLTEDVCSKILDIFSSTRIAGFFFLKNDVQLPYFDQQKHHFHTVQPNTSVIKHPERSAILFLHDIDHSGDRQWCK